MIRSALLAAALSLLLPSAQAMDVASIQVSSSGSVEVLPDYINIDVSIERTDMDRAVAKRQADEITQQVLDAIQALGVKDEHVDASRLFIYPQYRWNEQTRVLLGQRAVRTVQIKLYDLEKYSDLADRLVDIDISSMNQQGAGFDDLESHRNAAVVDALKNAQTKAEVIAGQIGRKLGAVFQVSETPSQVVHYTRQGGVQMAAEAMSDGGAPAPLEIKEQTITAEIHVIYLLLE